MAKEQRGINYRTITPQSMVALDTSGSAAQRGAQTGFAIGAQIRARIDAARAIEKANQAAKDKWRDSQMATITDTSFVDKVDPSIHEGAFTWLKGKQQEYGDVLDALSAEGMNSKNPAWAELNNQKIRIEASFNNFSTNLDNFKKSRQTAIDMRSPNAGEGYNEVAKTLNSENALNFLVDRQFSGGYGDMQINDDGSFSFPETNYDGKPIGSDNLPTLTEMPYEQQNLLIQNELKYGSEIKNGTYDINNEANNNRIRNEIHAQFRGMKTDQLQAYLLNDMDGEGGTPAFISDLAPGENPMFTWNDVYGKEQSMDYQSLMTNKEAMVSFATSKEYEGTIDYMKTMIPKDPNAVESGIVHDTVVDILSSSKENAMFYEKTGDPEIDLTYSGPKTGFDENKYNNTVVNELGSTYGESYKGDMMYSRDDMFEEYLKQYTLENSQTKTGSQWDGISEIGKDMRAEAAVEFNREYGDSNLFVANTRRPDEKPQAITMDFNDKNAVMRFLVNRGFVTKNQTAILN